MMVEQINGYIALPVAISEDSKHYIYVKKHSSNDKSDEDRTVFAVNLPVDVDSSKVRQLCQAVGGTIMEEFSQEGGRAQVKFVDKSSCNRFLNKAKGQASKGSTIEWPESQLSGSGLYMALNKSKFLDQGALQRQVDNYMQLFAEAEEDQQRQAQMMANQVDEDGFIMVGTAKPKMGSKPAKLLTKADLEAANPKKKKEKSDFYRFQLREQKKMEMRDLLQRYQNDKEKVRRLREQKRFRPY